MHCQKTGQILYICDAENIIIKDHCQPDMEQRMTITKIPLENLKCLDHRIELAVGIKAIVTVNIVTNADLMNGSREMIMDILLDT